MHLNYLVLISILEDVIKICLEIGNYDVEDAFKVNDLADKLKKEKIESNNW